MTENRKELIEILNTAVDVLTLKHIKCEITIVGGFAIYLNYNDFPRETYDIDAISDNSIVGNLGISLGVMDVIENFGDYKSNRRLLSEYSTSTVHVYVLNPEGLIHSKRISGRKEPDVNDIKFIEEKLKE